MPRRGPWITPPVTTLTLDLGHTITLGEFSSSGAVTERHGGGPLDFASGFTFVDVCETLGGVGGAAAVGSQVIGRRDLGSPWAVAAGQFRLKVKWDALRAAMTHYSDVMLGIDPMHFHETWPPAAVDFEAPGYFDALTPASLRSALHVATTVPSNPRQIGGTTAPTPWSGDTFHPVPDTLELHLADAAWGSEVPGSAMSSATLLDDVALPALFDNTVAIAADVPLGAWRDDAVASLYPYWLDLVLALQSQRTYTQPTWGGYASPPDDTLVEETYGTLITAPTGMTLSVDWQPPTYRWIYNGTPPLRQAQRGDGLAGGTPRSTRDRSVLASNRARAASYL